jgi:hypothetical protein
MKICKIHIEKSGCNQSHYYGEESTDNPSEITCKRCLTLLDRRAGFPAVPTFGATRTPDGIQLTFICPVCEQRHWHGAGGCGAKFGAGNGHRASHCYCWRDGYILEEVAP